MLQAGTMQNTLKITDNDILSLLQEKESAIAYREHRHEAWNDNYTLSRDKVITNRLTQRQTINVPLMKYGIATVMKDIDEPPMLYFSNLSNNQQKEIFYNEYWKEVARKSKLVTRDWMDKKQVCLYGRSFKKLNIVNGIPLIEIVDPQDMLIDRNIDPADIHTARCIIQIGIFRTLKEVVENELYDESEREKLKAYYGEYQAELLSESNSKYDLDRNKRMENMGVIDVNDPEVGVTTVELNEVYRKEYDENEGCIKLMFYVLGTLGSQTFKLYKKPLNKHIGDTEDDYWYDHHIYSSWGADPERLDFWSDAPADSLRQLNKALNSWISQLVENRMLRNFNMHYYDSSNSQFIPQTFNPTPWGWYPTPGNPNELIKDVQVGDLSESLDEIQFIISIGEKAVAASSAQSGAIEQRSVTLGEVQLALANAQERTKSMTKFYNESWQDIGLGYVKMLEASSNLLDPLKVSRRGKEGKKIYTKIIKPDQWMDNNGYMVEVKMKQDKEVDDANAIQKINAVKVAMLNNAPLNNIYKKKLLEFANLSTEEIKEVMDFEKQNDMSMMNGVHEGMVKQPVQGGNLMLSSGQAMPVA
jgi:hypothetical protein